MAGEIPSPSPTTAPEPASPPQDQFRSLDDTVEHCIGHFSRRQFLQSIILSFAWFFDAQQLFISIFTDAEPKWSCTISTSYNSSCNKTSSSNLCHLPQHSWSWDLPARTSTISEWSLQCAGPIITGLPASSFFFGSLIGAFVLSTLADSSLGRKKMLVLCCSVMSVSGALTAVSTNVWIYNVLRFVSGFGRATIGTTALVHASELLGRKWRAKVGVIGFLFFTLGFLALPIIAFLLRGYSWRLVYLFTCVPCVFYSILLYFSVHESPRWLFIKGRKQEFIKTLRTLASLENRSNLTESFFTNCMKWEEKSGEDDNTCTAFKMLLSKRWAVKRLVATMVVAFGIGLTYFGMPLGLGNLSFNLYLGAVLNALSEFPSSLATFYLVGKLKRRSSVVGFALLSGICSVASVFVRLNKGMQMGLEILSFFSACTAFDVFFIYTLELFPTCVRNFAMSMVREATLLSGVLAPALVAVAKNYGLFVSYGVFGVTISVCGLFVGFLPETKGRKLYDTMEEEELEDAGESVSEDGHRTFRKCT